MEVIYYFDKKLGFSPVKKYLTQYVTTNRDSVKERANKYYIISSIDEKIKHIIEECNGRPTPPIAKPLRNYSFFEIGMRKNSNILIRILYFCSNNKMVLLNAFEKSAHYNTERERRKIEKYYNKTDEYRNKFIKNQKSYEKYGKKKIN